MSKEVVREYVKRFDRGDVEGLRELFHEDAQIHVGGDWVGLTEIIPMWQAAVDGLGVDLELEQIIGDAEVVAVLCIERGWSRAPFLDRPVTGRSYEMPTVDWFVISSGLIARQWSIRDVASQALQLGWETIAPAAAHTSSATGSGSPSSVDSC